MFRILIVDDTKSVHAYLKLILVKVDGVTIESVFDGQQAVSRLKKSQDFDLILLDWEMPILNGPQTLKELKKIQLLPPVIMLTSKNEIADIELVLELGASEFVMKPFTADILFEKIDSVARKEWVYAV